MAESRISFELLIYCMTKLNALSKEECSVLFGADANQVPVLLVKLTGARVLWINPKAIQNDCIYSGDKNDLKNYERHILDSCAYEVESTSFGLTSTRDLVIGYADRYGGTGIGNNGGSGRAVVINGYHVKGIGKTPLVSSLPEDIFSTGEAYLEECVRETIFSELVSLEFPHSSIPTLAIIDTRISQISNTTKGQIFKRRTLLVRPSFIRPAHFERATGFVNGNAKVGEQDQRRVSRFFSNSISIFGHVELQNSYQNLWPNWSRQLAYSFVNRLLHGSNTTSNISLDGRLVDFGAMSSTPSWANTAINLQRQPFSRQFNYISSAINSLSYYFGRHLDKNIGHKSSIEKTKINAFHEYKKSIAFEVLTLFGVDSRSAAEATASGFESIFAICSSLIQKFQAQHFDLIDVRTTNIPWDIHLVWSDDIPAHLRPMRNLLNDLVPIENQRSAMLRCMAHALSRPNLHREKIKQEIHTELELGFALGDIENSHRITEYIDASVIKSSRKTHPLNNKQNLITGVFTLSREA